MHQNNIRLLGLHHHLDIVIWHLDVVGRLAHIHILLRWKIWPRHSQFDIRQISREQRKQQAGT